MSVLEISRCESSDSDTTCSSSPSLSPLRRKVPIVYHPDYDVSLCGVPFTAGCVDSKRHAAMFRSLSERLSLSLDDLFEPLEASREELLAVHSSRYLQALALPATLARSLDVLMLSLLSAASVEKNVLRPLRLAAGGTLLAAALALQYGWAANLSGGFHCAKTQGGRRLDLYADIPLAVRALLRDERLRVKRVLIVDLDARRGSGYQTLFALHDELESEHGGTETEEEALVFTDDERVHIFDMHCAVADHCSPQCTTSAESERKRAASDALAKQFTTYDLSVHPLTRDEDYLLRLENHLPPAMRASSPDIVFFNAGANVHEDEVNDYGLCLSTSGIVHRDEFVVRTCRENGVPVVILPSFSAHPNSAEIFVTSLLNLHAKELISIST